MKHLNRQDNTLYLYDIGSRRTNEYTFDGKFIKHIKNDSIAAFRMLKDGNYAVSYSPFVNTNFALGIYDKSWNLKRTGLSKNRNNIKFDMIYLDGIFKFNDECFYKLAHGDTLYRITSSFDEPYLVHSKGKYNIPLIINEKKIYVWPTYVSDKALYCIIENEDAISLIPSLPADTNPIILEVRIK